MNVGIDKVDQVLKVGVGNHGSGEMEVTGVIKVDTMANVKKPLGEPLKVWITGKTHVLSEFELSDVIPKARLLETGTHDLLARALWDDREDLLKVTTKDDGDTPKGASMSQISLRWQSTASGPYLGCIGTSSQMIKWVDRMRLARGDCLEKSHLESSKMSRGILNMLWEVRPPNAGRGHA